MDRSLLTDEQWAVILAFLLRHPHVYVENPLTCRAFLEAVLWVLRSGGQWRLLPAARGAWNNVFKRFARWQRRGVWAELQAHVVRDPDLQQLLIDSTVVRAHPCAAGAEQSSRRKPWAVRGAALAPRFMPSPMPWVTPWSSSSPVDKRPTSGRPNG